eukprot:gene24621-biopygen11921
MPTRLAAAIVLALAPPMAGLQWRLLKRGGRGRGGGAAALLCTGRASQRAKMQMCTFLYPVGGGLRLNDPIRPGFQAICILHAQQYVLAVFPFCLNWHPIFPSAAAQGVAPQGAHNPPRRGARAPTHPLPPWPTHRRRRAGGGGGVPPAAAVAVRRRAPAASVHHQTT